MAHRGPNSRGIARAGIAILGHNRLSILDLTSAGGQPMADHENHVFVVFNGEIYNFRSLRRTLETDYEFNSSCDTEVLIAGYLAWGWGGLLEKIDGMFALAIWDTRTETLFAARDRLGKKPFFYAHDAGRLIFASTLNGLKELMDNPCVIDPFALEAYLTFHAVPSPMTIYRGVRQLPPAHALEYDAHTGNIKIERYWDVSHAGKARMSEADALEELDDLLRRAVRRRLVSDVPLGAFLSGGVDSSLVVAMMAQESPSKVNAIVAGFSDPRFDETRYARRVAEHCGTDLHAHRLKANAVDCLPEIIWQYGQPLADVSIVPTYHVAKAAKQHVTVVLNGDGGDEVFGGYARPVVARAAQLYRRALPLLGARRFAASGAGLLPGRKLKPLRMLASAGRGSAAEAFTYDRGLRLYRDAAYTSQFTSALEGWDADVLYQDAWNQGDGDDVDHALYGDMTTYLPDQLLAKMDVSTMAHSLEARSPLLDTAVVEFGARIPTALRLKGFTTKYLLKKLASWYVPHDVIYRRKKGFVMPAGDWMRGELAVYVKAALLNDRFHDRGWIEPAFTRRVVGSHLDGAEDWGEQLWTLFVLELWARQSLDGTLNRGDSLEALL